MTRWMRWLGSLLAFVGLFAGVQWHVQAQAGTDTAAYAVVYIAVRPAARTQMLAAFKQYRDTSQKEGGYARFELLEQAGRPGYFAIVETWTDQKAFATHGMAAHVKQFRSALEPIRVSDYDERPYKVVTVAPETAAPPDNAVHVVAHVDTTPAADGPGLLRPLAETSRKEQGCLRFDVLQHTMRPNHFTVIEVWQSQKALDAHAAAVHTKRYRDAFQLISGGPLDERLYKAIE